MIKKSLKKWYVVSSLAALLGTGIYTYGCADGWWSYSSISNFTPEAFADESYKPLFFAPYDRFYNGGYMDNSSMFNDDIVAEWTTYLQGKLEQAEVKKYLLSSQENAAEIDQLYANLKGKKSTTWNLKDERIQNFVTFLYHAKAIEMYSNDTYSYWNYESHVATLMEENQADKVEKIYKNLKSKDAFYANRMWFQVMKAKFYSTNRASAIAFFNESAAKQPKNNLYYRALGYVAGAYYQAGDYDQSNVLYAEIFNANPTLRQVALYNYKPRETESVRALVQTIPNKEVQAALWAMQGYYSNAMDALKEVVAVDSKSPHANFLLTRWVNEQEASVLQFREESFKTSKEYFGSLKKKIDQPGLDWVKKIAKEEKVDNPALWYMASGYLAIFQGQYKEADEAFVKAKKEAKGNALVENQIRLFGLINQVSQIKKVDAKAEQAILEDMQWIYNEIIPKANWEDPFRYDYALHWVRQYLAAIYAEQGNNVMSEIMYSNLDFYGKVEHTVKMEQFLLATKKTKFEQLMVDKYQYNLSDIYERRAINLFYQDKIDQAIVEMKKAEPITATYEYSGESYVKTYKNTELLGNPFNGKIQDCNDCDHMAKQSVKYTKLSFLEKIKEMQDKIAQGEDVFNNALLVGNAFYNGTYYGNARVFYYNALVNEYGNFISPSERKYLLNMALAKKYYGLAKKAATTKEQKAKMAYLEAKVERNEFYANQYQNKDYYWGAGWDDPMFKKWKGFQELATLYSDTKYYQDVINECGYFRTYLEKNQ
ncbi:tetratricopeptide repeat protein [Myroides sp. TSA_177.3]|uniref:tetratricopeptide repeat protein n=1 Tax=Myroides sp. TSA_177.3 TaxID=3415650 RepID=UPI0040458B9C